jgi:hypothetical protein
MRSAFVDLVVVGIFTREQISLRSATLRDLLWGRQRRGREKGGRGRTVLNPLRGKRVRCAVHVTSGVERRKEMADLDWVKLEP